MHKHHILRLSLPSLSLGVQKHKQKNKPISFTYLFSFRQYSISRIEHQCACDVVFKILEFFNTKNMNGQKGSAFDSSASWVGVSRCEIESSEDTMFVHRP